MRIVIVEDQTILRESLAHAIDSQADMNVVGRLADAALAPDAAIRLKADLVLMDVCTENDSSGIAATRKIKQERPEIKVIVMTGMPEVTFIDQSKEAEADGFVYKNIGTDDLMGIIRSTMDGYSTFPRHAPGMFSGASALTDIEMEILRLVCKTKTRKEIASALYLSEGTLKRHISEILAKTGYDNILRLAIHAVASGAVVPTIRADDRTDSN